MKNFRILAILFLAASLCSCDKMFENKTLNEWDEDEYSWRVHTIAEGILLQTYAAIPRRADNFDGDFLDAATDNAVTNAWSSSVYQAGAGRISAANNPLGNWANCLQQIQTVNEFLEKGLTDKVVYDRTSADNDKALKEKLYGEAHFLRAWWGFQLLQRHGGRTDGGEVLGYPISTYFVLPQHAGDLTYYERDTYELCVKQILADCDVAISILPDKYSGTGTISGIVNLGRGDATIAKALRSRVSLYAASPAFRTPDVVEITGMGQYTVKDAAKYKEKWITAAMYADELIQMAGFGDFYALKATDLAMKTAVNTPGEFMFRTYRVDNEMEVRHYPPYYNGTARNTPSQNLVDAFPTKDGYPIGDSRSSYAAADPYTGRDNRLGLIAYYQGRDFAASGVGIDVVAGGKDANDFNEYGTRTGYYLAKFLYGIDPALIVPPTLLTAPHYNPLMRKGEVFLNFAEASNEAWGPTVKGPGCKYSAYDIIKMVREKSGGITDTGYLDEMAASTETFRTLIQNERRLELAFENHWFFDIRRWLLLLDGDVTGVSVERDGNGVLTFSDTVVEKRAMGDVKYYYLPVPHSEILKSDKMVNNMGW